MADRIILINKPYGWTSFDVVKKLRKPLLEEKKRELSLEEKSQLKKIKVGHAGTLDPLATGLLVICSGKFTGNITEIQDAEKEYTGTIVIGAVTDSYDLETVPRDALPFEHVSEKVINDAASFFEGALMQTPPIHSAKKINGQRAYIKARRGDDFELKANPIVIKSFKITSIRLPEIDFCVICSKGTYIRSLANDFGKKLGTGGYLSALCRTRIGSYNLTDSHTIDEFLNQLYEKQVVK